VSDEVKRMSDLLKSGATMLSETCPQCNSPLFKINNELLCVKCNRPVVVIKATEDESGVIAAQSLGKLEQTALMKIDEINSALKVEKDYERIDKLRQTLSEWLTIVERVRKLRGSS
jgi:UPF0148 protein